MSERILKHLVMEILPANQYPSHLEATPEWIKHTVVTLRTTPQSRLKIPEIPVADYLYLISKANHPRAVSKDLEVYFGRDTELWQGLLKDIYIYEESNLTGICVFTPVRCPEAGKQKLRYGFTLNYVGPPKLYSSLKLGRDRNIFDVGLLIKMIPDVFPVPRDNQFDSDLLDLAKMLYLGMSGGGLLQFYLYRYHPYCDYLYVARCQVEWPQVSEWQNVRCWPHASGVAIADSK